MAPSKPTLIFSPGAWHTGASFKPTTDALNKEGFNCIALDLPCIGSELKGLAPQQDWSEDVSHIRNAILDQLDGQGANVVLIVHSYSGTVGSEACKGLDEASRRKEGKETCVAALVYLSAIVLDVDGWIWEASGGKPVDERRTVMKGDLCYVADMEGWFYNRCSPDAVATAQAQLQSHAWKAFFSKVTHTAWRHIPSWYLYATNDQAVPVDVQKLFTSYEGAKWKTRECDADHSPMICRVSEVVGIVKEAVEETSKGS